MKYYLFIDGGYDGLEIEVFENKIAITNAFFNNDRAFGIIEGRAIKTIFTRNKNGAKSRRSRQKILWYKQSSLFE